jgi:membrane-bound lytic murein transglycosylase D
MKFRALFVFWACFFCLAANNCCVSSDKEVFAKELKSMEKDIPLPYHEALDKTMKQLADKNLPTTFMTHEAFIDSALLQRGMPLELKYLPYALSGMKADYHNGDRCGYWALPTLVGMRYGLSIDGAQDERLSVGTSTLAALDYLNDLHEKYNDWWHCILAYANSPTSLSHAMIHYGSEPELWDFYEHHLMPNTNVIADFIACVYLGKEGRLKFGSKTSASSSVKGVEPVDSMNKQKNMDSSTLQQVQDSKMQFKEHIIKKGETLSGIAVKHHVTVEELMEWNHLENDKIFEGNTLIIKKK